LGSVLGGSVMSARKSQPNKTAADAAMEIQSVARRFLAEDERLKLPLLDAAVAGIVLAFKPDHREMRRQAARAWGELETLLWEHIAREEDKLVPWAENLPKFPREVLEGIERRSADIRILAHKIGTVDFEKDQDEAVGDAGAALSLLAVKLDDLIESEERKLMPKVQRAIATETAADTTAAD
jgi:hypothetical protein